jgi:transposase
MADLGGRVPSLAARGVEVICIDALWLCTKPVDMRCSAERLLAHVVHALGSANAHHGYVFANVRATRIKMIVHDGFGVWCAARRLNVGRFVWPCEIDASRPIAMTQAQFDALVVGLPWQHLPEMSVIARL